MSHIASFRTKLACLTSFLDDPSVSEIAINRPGEVWIARQGHRHMTRQTVPALTFALLKSLADVTASHTQQETDRRRPLLSATIPINLSEGVPDHERGGYRIQVILPPTVEEGTLALCIRKPTLLDITLSEYQERLAFKQVNETQRWDLCRAKALMDSYTAGHWSSFLREAVRQKLNIVISAGTNTGKTTFLNALLKEIPIEERLVTIEDSREIRPPHPNCLHLVYSRGEQGVSQVTAVDLLEASLRLTPDRAIMGELRGSEAYSYLELLNTGHSGSITTIHADSPELMFERLAQMVMRFGSTLNKDQIISYAKSLIDVVVQLKRDNSGERYVSNILYQP